MADDIELGSISDNSKVGLMTDDIEITCIAKLKSGPLQTTLKSVHGRRQSILVNSRLHLSPVDGRRHLSPVHGSRD